MVERNRSAGDRSGFRVTSNRAMWACGLVMAAISLGVLLAYGVTAWTVTLAAILLACPLAVAIALATGRPPTR